MPADAVTLHAISIATSRPPPALPPAPRLAMALGLVLLASTALHAQTGAAPQAPATCAPPATSPQAMGTEPLQQAVLQQGARLPQCQQSVAWLAWMGHALNSLARYPEAAQYLERAVLLDPLQAGIQVEYALALAGSGDGLAAIQLLQSLLTEPALPADLRAPIQQQVARWTAPVPAPAWQNRSYLSARLGHDSNLLGTPNLATLTLTLPGQSLQLPLDASYLSRPGYYSRLEAGTSVAKGPWQLAANLAARHSAQEPDAQLQQAQASAEHSAAHHYASTSLGFLHSRGGTRYRTAGLAAGLQWSSGESGDPRAGQPCQTRLGPEWQQRELGSNPILSGYYRGLVWQHACQVAPASAGTALLQAWQISARWGQDIPRQASRPGGPQRQASLRSVLVGSGNGVGHQWLIDAELSRQQDASGYSALLQDNAVRKLGRLALRAEYSLPMPLLLPPAWQLTLGTEWQRQRANLPLFQQRSHGGYVALRTQW